jgi:hypothetical protein
MLRVPARKRQELRNPYALMVQTNCDCQRSSWCPAGGASSGWTTTRFRSAEAERLCRRQASRLRRGFCHGLTLERSAVGVVGCWYRLIGTYAVVREMVSVLRLAAG